MPKLAKHTRIAAKAHIELAHTLTDKLNTYYDEVSDAIICTVRPPLDPITKTVTASSRRLLNCPIIGWLMSEVYMSQEEVANILGVTTRSVISYTSGKTSPNKSSRMILALLHRQLSTLAPVDARKYPKNKPENRAE